MKRVFVDSKHHFSKRVALKLEQLDMKNQFRFSSIDGKKARAIFVGNYSFLRKNKYIVFLEGKKVWVKANAVLRIYWLIGGPWKILGFFFFVPGFIVNPIYCIMALFVRR